MVMDGAPGCARGSPYGKMRLTMAKKSGNQNRRRAGQRRSQSRSGGSRNRRPAGERPLPPGDSFATPKASPARAAIERRSATLLVFLHRVPRWVPLALILVLFAAGVLVTGVLGGVLLGLVSLVLAWLAYVSWPVLRTGDRVLRVATIVMVLAGAVYFAIQT